tara:strand:- start:571 stop:822 length:252 start_codon:yes stop_codon:yes gene_type:complete
MKKEILKYVKKEGWELRHNVDALSFASEKTANLLSDVEPMEVIKFMLGDMPIKGHYTHSYGFLTREGRDIREFFGTKYHEYLS